MFDWHAFQGERYKQAIGDEDVIKIFKRLKDRKFSAKDLKISYRELSYWSESGLFSEKEHGKWRLFTMPELVWIEIISELRRYGLSLDKIRHLKNNLLEPRNVIDLLLVDPVLMTDGIKRKFGLDIDYKDFERTLRSAKVPDDIKNLEYSLFELVLFDVYFLKLEYRLFISYSGDFLIHVGFETDEFKDAIAQVKEFDISYITISISAILASIFSDYAPYELSGKWKLINEQEEKILELLNSPFQIKSLTIKFDSNREINLVEYTQDVKISPHDYLRKLMIKGGYQKIQLITQKGDIVSSERTVRQKL